MEKLNILDELNKGCSMGMEAIHQVLERVDDKSFQELLEEFHEEYDKLSSKIKDEYHEYSDSEVHEVNMMEKIMTWYGITKDTMMDNSTSKYADLMINGTNMGIVEGRKLLNHKKMDHKIKSLCQEYVDMQEEYIEKLKEFL